MNAYCELKDMLCSELEEIVSKGELSTGELDIVDKLTHSIKSLETIIAMNDYSCDNKYYTGNSYARNRKRDSMGRYSRDIMYDHRDKEYSRENNKVYMIEQLESMLIDAKTEKEREAIRKCINQIEG